MKARRAIVTTTINPPTKALTLFSQKEEWDLIVVGDLKTPHDRYKEINCTYLDPDYQHSTYPDLSRAIGWNCIQRRNIGFVEAYKKEYKIIATVDDDNIPYSDWGINCHIGNEVEVDLYRSPNGYFDPLSVTNNSWLWHRGYPVEHVPTKNRVEYLGKHTRNVLIQADLWDGDPDIDALCRLPHRPMVKFKKCHPFGSVNPSPFNSQNTFLHRSVLPHFPMIPHVGRMDDIWGSYLAQKMFPNSLIYCKPTVFQDRNPQDLVSNLEKEILGYRNTLDFIDNASKEHQSLPAEAKNFLEAYSSAFD